MSWWKQKKSHTDVQGAETAAEYWAKRDAERAELEAREAVIAADPDWTGYAAPATEPGAELFNYELSAYSDRVGYASDGIQRVSVAFDDDDLAAYRMRRGGR